ncbi:MAG: hypothetical protein ABSA45_10635 [Verrucomicrobiota bacterium]|jgi:hypothetical protein
MNTTLYHGKWSDLLTLIDDVHKEAETAARKKETAKLLKATDWLRRATELQTRHSELLKQAERLVLERHGSDDTTSIGKLVNLDSDDSTSASADFGGKFRADECRAAYLDRERKNGNPLNRVRRSYFKNAAGLTVGITYSSEDRSKSCPWFLNLLDGQFDEAVLLCETTKEAVQVIHLPKTFLDRYGKQMSRGKKGQLKFNVSKRNGRFSLQVPDPVGWIDITDYTEKEPLTCPHLEFV